MYSGFYCSKGRGLEMYCEWNRIHLEDTIAFGDNENDNSLLLLQVVSLPKKTAIQTQKTLADDITDYDCLDDGGVGHYIFDHLLNQQG